MELSKKNHGTAREKSGGTTFLTPYGKDDSDVTGSTAQERMPSFKGGMDNLSHSLSGTSANQKGS